MMDVKKIKEERDFFAYLGKLHEMRSNLVILIAASNTPFGPFFTAEMTNFFRKSMGLRVDLYGQYRVAYAVCIERGNIIAEHLGKDREQNIDLNLLNNKGISIRIQSAGFEGVPQRNLGLIELNGKKVSLNRRGLNFVILDAATCEVVDVCCVDTFIEKFVCYRKNEGELIKEYKERHPGVTLIGMNLPVFPKHDITQNEEYIKTHGLVDGMNIGYVFENLGELIQSKRLSLLQFYSKRSEIEEVLAQPESYTDVYGSRKFFDRSGVHVNTIGGIRITHGQPKHHRRAIFLIGNCNVFGVSASDEHTIASFLQRQLNEKVPHEEFIVYNYGYYLMNGLNEPFYDEYKILASLPARRGDVIILLWDISSLGGDTLFCDLSQVAQRPHEYGEVFFCIDHYTPAGYHLIADRLYDFLSEHQFFRTVEVPERVSYSNLQFSAESKFVDNNGFGFTSEAQHELTAYKEKLRKAYIKIKPRIGAVVMNCNPFTLGHRYLVEKALKSCDHLFVFVVEEDKSVFPFLDRLCLVKKGLEDLANVTVLPSGKFIISTLTFTEYFNKSKMQDVKVDTSLDIMIFAKEIAPCLDITIRFVGTEPFDRVTAQYNESMNSILTQYGIEVQEIPRCKAGGRIISASYVRELLGKKAWDEIEAFVPKHTLEYLQQYDREHVKI